MKNIDQAAFKTLYLKDTEFKNLMQKRIYNVLLIATPYDAFMLEDDGRVDEQVYFEYVKLNLSSPPRFTKAGNYEEAYSLLKEKDFDLIIAMPGVDVSETFREAIKIDELYPEIPFVVLTPFSKEVRRRIADEDLRGVDYVFSWLGNVDLILAIIKLIEDKMNADNDILDVGVQCVMLVEDSIRFYSAILPHLFKFLLKQSMVFSEEALNEHEQMLRMRGRAKVLLARDYSEAKALFDKYGENMLGVITDVRFPQHSGTREKDPEAGLKLTRYIYDKNPCLPVIIESSESHNRGLALNVGGIFLDKSSKTLPQDLRHAIRDNFGFGDFIVRDPATGHEIMRIPNLKSLQRNIFNIPGDSLFYHCSVNDVSRWLYSRALFPIADAIKKYKFTEMSESPAVRQLIFECIVKYRRMKNRGVVAVFQKDRFDKYSNFARIGEGSLGGKGRGLAFIDQIIKRNPVCENFGGVEITIPKTVVLCTDIFDEFMEENNLYPIALSSRPDTEILATFLKAQLPLDLTDNLRALLDVMDKPLAVRSSSLLEDSHYQPFAGVYSTYMIPHLEDTEKHLELLQDAVKSVYASVFFADSKAYMNATSNVIDQEKMAIILQEVASENHDGYFYPSFSGVGRSLNYYPINDEVAEDGVAEVAVGLGKYIVDGGMALRFSPNQPHKVLQTSTLDLALRDTQTFLFALPSDEQSSEHFTVDDGFNIKKIPVNDAAKSGALKFLASTYNAYDGRIVDNDLGPGRKVITFANVLQHNVFPLAKIIEFMLRTGQYEMGRPVEIEFAGNIEPDANSSQAEKKGTLYWLQIRPIVDKKEMLDDSILNLPDKELILRSGTALGHGVMDNVMTVVYVKPSTFDSSRNEEVAQEIEKINRKLIEEEKPYILIGPGRWGSSDHALGIPVKWPQIAGARLIVESALPGYRIEPSQGTHFFQNLTSFGVGYFTIDQDNGQGFCNYGFLDETPAVYESDAVRIVEFQDPLMIAINGRKSAGIVAKPQP
ncbi:MAG: phosphoenolpyruvate synthase [Prevotella sp.]|nr:phosphoenolpyruvate synthase [Bacteroides sp.]MCM1365713.1 phosphoenolpyruvate synthase [Prevotella sp.]MCM1436383.1 phosphoenolpyruvate synthase [Prevotella sp.]